MRSRFLAKEKESLRERKLEFLEVKKKDKQLLCKRNILIYFQKTNLFFKCSHNETFFRGPPLQARFLKISPCTGQTNRPKTGPNFLFFLLPQFAYHAPMAFTSSPLLRHLPRLRFRLPRHAAPRLRSAAWLSTLEAAQPGDASCATAKPPDPPRQPSLERPEHTVKSWAEHPDYRRWKDNEEEIFKDIEPIRLLTKEILHSDR